MKEIGKVTHYYDKIGVAIIELTGPLKNGDTVVFKGKEEVEQVVASMQIDHAPVEEAKAGDVIGIKVETKINPGTQVLLK